MSSIKPKILQYLTACFRPISITASVEEWKKIKYTNRLFSVEMIPNYDIYERYKDGYKDRIPNIFFQYNNFNTGLADKQFSNPATLMAELILEKLQTRFDFDIYKEIDGQKLATFKSNGQVPNRYIRMLHDFYFKQSTIVEEKEDPEYWNFYINQIPEHTLKNLLNVSTQIMHNHMNIKVIKSPDYYKELDEYLEMFKITKTDIPTLDSIMLDISLYFDRGISKEDNTYIFYHHIMKNRVWYTGDCCMSYPVKIFTKKCNKYTSLHKDLIHPSSIYNPMNELAKCEGGLSMNYLNREPWRSLYLSTGELYRTSWAEIVGSNSYSSGKNVGIEEFVVLEEILKKEGAVIEVTI